MPLRNSLRRKVADTFATADTEDTAPADALFDESLRSGQLRRIPLDQVSPRAGQPRRSMDPEALEELTQSIRDHGVLQPIRVRAKKGDGYEIIAGERRWTAAQHAGVREIPAVVVTADDDQAYVEALIENIQREDLNALDRAKALVHLRVALGRQSWEEVGKVLGIGRQHVHRLLNVTKLPEPIQEDIRVGQLTEKHGRALVTLRGYPQQQTMLWERIHEEGLSGDATVAAARELRPATAQSAPAPTANGITAAIDDLRHVLESARPGELRAAREQLNELRLQISEALVAASGASPTISETVDG